MTNAQLLKKLLAEYGESAEHLALLVTEAVAVAGPVKTVDN